MHGVGSLISRTEPRGRAEAPGPRPARLRHGGCRFVAADPEQGRAVLDEALGGMARVWGEGQRNRRQTGLGYPR